MKLNVVLLVDKEVIIKFYENFNSLDNEEKGFVNSENFLNKLNYKEDDHESLLIKSILKKLETEDNNIDFVKLIKLIQNYKNENKESKLKFLFEFLDTDKKNKLSIEDLEKGFKMVKVNEIDSNEIKDIAKNTLVYADADKDGFLNYDEFKEFYNSVLNITI